MNRNYKKLLALADKVIDLLEESEQIFLKETETKNYDSKERQINKKKLLALYDEISPEEPKKKEAIINYEQNTIFIKD